MRDLIKNDIENDFYSCIGEFNNLNILMNALSDLKINDNDSEEAKRTKHGQIKGLLIQLGRIGELAFKYLLKIKQTQLYPNQDYKQFSDTQRIYKVGQIRDLANKNLISQADAEEILDFEDENGQKFHNFVYLGLVAKKLIPDTYSNFEKCIQYAFESEMVLKTLREMDKEMFSYEMKIGEYPQYVLFPSLIWISELEVDNERINKLITNIKNNADNSGDIFTRLRYYSNNLDNKQYDMHDVNTIFIYIYWLVEFIKGVYKSNNNLSVNAESIHGRERALRYPKLVGRSIDEINVLFDKFCEEDPLFISQKLFSGCSLEEIEKIESLSNDYGIDSFMVYEYGLSSEDLMLFHSIGCDNPIIMQDLLFDDKLNKRTIDEIKKIISEGYSFPYRESKNNNNIKK